MEKLKPNESYKQNFEKVVFAEILQNQLKGRLSPKDSVKVQKIQGRRAFLVEFDLPRGHEYHGVSFCVLHSLSATRVQRDIHTELTNIESFGIIDNFLRRYD